MNVDLDESRYNLLLIQNKTLNLFDRILGSDTAF